MIPPLLVAARNIEDVRDGAQGERAGLGRVEDNMDTNKEAREGSDPPGLFSQAQDLVYTSRSRKAAQVRIRLEGV